MKTFVKRVTTVFLSLVMTVTLLPLSIGSAWAVELPATEEGAPPPQTTTADATDPLSLLTAEASEQAQGDGEFGVLAIQYGSFKAFVDNGGGGGGMWSEGPTGTFTLTSVPCTLPSGDSVTILNTEKVIISSGVTFNNNGNLINNGGIDIGGTLTNDGTLINNEILNNWGSLINNDSFTNNGDGTFNNNTIGIFTNEGSFTNIGTLTNNGALTNASTGTLTLSSSGFSGNIANDGHVVLSSPSNQSYVYGSTISGTGAVSKEDSGTFILTGDNTYTDATIVSAGTLKLGDGIDPALLASGSITVDQSASFICDVPGQASLTYPGTFSGQGTFIKEGTGTLVLTEQNTVGGTMQVSTGTLELEGDLTTASFVIGSDGVLINKALLYVDSSFENDGEVANPGLIVSPATSTQGYTGAHALNTLVFDANGGTVSSPLALSTSFLIAEPDNSADFDKIFNEFERAGLIPTRSGFTLLGWAEKQSPTTYVASPYTFTSGSTLYAQWQADPTPVPSPPPAPVTPAAGRSAVPPATGDTTSLLLLAVGTVILAGLTFVGVRNKRWLIGK